MRLSGTKTSTVSSSKGLGNQLYDLGGARPTLDLNFANNESLDDSITGKNLVTHTRASSATYVDGDGVIQNAVTNLLLRSEEFDDSSWYKSYLTSVTSGFEAPDNSFSAEKLIANATLERHYIQRTVTITAGGTYTLSCYAKAGEYNYATIVFGMAGSPYTRAGSTVDLTTGAITNYAVGSPTSVVRHSAQSVGNGWWRISITVQIDGVTTSGYAELGVSSAGDNYGSFSGDGTSGVYLWGAQLEQSDTVGEYVKTTSTINSAPRFDHDPSTGESLGLLVEESRTNLVDRSENNFGAAAATKTENVVVAPDGNTTADQFEATGGGAFKGSIPVTNGAKVTYSVFLKKISGSGILTSVGFNKFGSTNVNGKVRVDLNNGTISNSDPLVEDSSITAYSNGWYRVSVTATATDTTTTVVNYCDIGQVGAHTFSVWGMQVEEGAFPTSYIPTDGATVTRAADIAEITGNDFGTFNLVEYSEEFEAAQWTKFQASIVPNGAVAPDGTKTADKIVNQSGVIALVRRDLASLKDNTDYTVSIHAKAGEFSDINLTFFDKAGAFSASGSFDTSTGQWTSSLSGGATNRAFENLGNGWYRLSVTVNSSSGGSTSNIRYTNDNTADGTSGLYLWGAQVEESSTVTPYVKSDVTFTSRASTATYYDADGIIQTAAVDEARTAAYLPDDNGNFISAGELLLEEARTNLLTESEDVTGYTLKDVTVPFDSSAVNPTGSLGSYKILANSGLSAAGVRINTFASSGNNIVVSAFVKKSTHRYVLIGFGGLGSSFTALFDVEPGLTSNRLLGQDTKGTSSTNISAGYQNLPNDWIRIWAVGTTTGTDGPTIGMGPDANTFRIINWTAAGTEEIYVWGLQYEDNATFPTSYIPTSGSTATRAADVSSSSSNTFGNGWYNQSEGTVFADADGLGSNVPSGDFHTLAAFNDGTNDSRIELGYMVATTAYWNLRVSGSTSVNLLPSISDIRRKLAGSFDSSLAEISVNGATALTDSSVVIPTVNKLDIGGLNSTDIKEFNGTIRRLTYWPERLSDATLQTITT